MSKMRHNYNPSHEEYGNAPGIARIDARTQEGVRIYAAIYLF